MNPPRLLIADDETAFRASLAAVLRLAGYDVSTCTIAQAHDKVVSTRDKKSLGLPVVVVDPRNPAGLRLVRAIRLASMNILAVVGCCDSLVRAELEMLGCPRLDKPVDRAALLDNVAAVLAHRPPPGAPACSLETQGKRNEAIDCL